MSPQCLFGPEVRRIGVAAIAALCLAGPLTADDATTINVKTPAAKVNPDHPLAPALDQAYKARKALEEVQDYEALFEKREVIDGRLVASKIQLKLREEPFSVYLKFHAPNEGREVIYVDGKNNGMLFAHEVGIKSIAGTVSLATNSQRAMEGNKYPVTMIGLRKLIDQVITQWEAEAKFGETDVKYHPDNPQWNGVEFKAIVSTHPKPRNQFKYKVTKLYIEKETNLPFRVEQYGFPRENEKTPPLVEEYTYTKLKTNVGLTDRDFDTKNPNYAFP